jgi:hypothetical protein
VLRLCSACRFVVETPFLVLASSCLSFPALPISSHVFLARSPLRIAMVSMADWQSLASRWKSTPPPSPLLCRVSISRRA